MKYPPRPVDLPREELVKAAEEAIKPTGMYPGGTISFKFTCQHCGERCIMQDENKLYEFGECHKCGKSTKIEYGGFLVHWVTGKDKKIYQTANLPSCACPVCGYQTDCASRVVNVSGDSGAPRPGDLTLCFKCGEILIFDEDLKSRTACLDDLLGMDDAQSAVLDRLQKKIRSERPLG